MKAKSTYDAIYGIVRRIPKGRVATYGEIAKLAGIAGRARQVGYALHALPARSPIPWHRVINTEGRISLCSTAGLTQRMLLEKEGVVFDSSDRVSLKIYGWFPAETARPKHRS